MMIKILNTYKNHIKFDRNVKSIYFFFVQIKWNTLLCCLFFFLPFIYVYFFIRFFEYSLICHLTKEFKWWWKIQSKKEILLFFICISTHQVNNFRCLFVWMVLIFIYIWWNFFFFYFFLSSLLFLAKKFERLYFYFYYCSVWCWCVWK